MNLIMQQALQNVSVTLNHQNCEEVFIQLPIEAKRAIVKMIFEHDRALKKFPDWSGYDIVHQAAIVSEESGELTRAALQLKFENGSAKEVEKELIQTGAMVLRMYLNS